MMIFHTYNKQKYIVKKKYLNKNYMKFLNICLKLFIYKFKIYLYIFIVKLNKKLLLLVLL